MNLLESVRALIMQKKEEASGAYAIISIILKLASFAESFEVTMKKANSDSISEIMLANWDPKSDCLYSRLC